MQRGPVVPPHIVDSMFPAASLHPAGRHAATASEAKLLHGPVCKKAAIKRGEMQRTIAKCMFDEGGGTRDD